MTVSGCGSNTVWCSISLLTSTPLSSPSSEQVDVSLIFWSWTSGSFGILSKIKRRNTVSGDTGKHTEKENPWLHKVFTHATETIQSIYYYFKIIITMVSWVSEGVFLMGVTTTLIMINQSQKNYYSQLFHKWALADWHSTYLSQAIGPPSSLIFACPPETQQNVH